MLGVNYHVGPGNIICQEITCVACEPSTPIGENHQNLNCTTSRITFFITNLMHKPLVYLHIMH